ncbi:uncharacterized protein LOC106474794 isoform X2 [Limulus polyphemus]|uniref:Uncharacterized protein LOC106474794 isoform X2 n=1 Tax=Limulus polyphemus TaxID=6850 RepID=A0ABM1TSF0_LIMPO|nr:uncharacterized protein LOC106474794 isoform X2 [Limulus polyphemus]
MIRSTMKENETEELGNVGSSKMQVPFSINVSSNNTNHETSKNELNKASLMHENSRFEGVGVRFKAKLIGVEHVNEARGKVICQTSLQKLKDAIKRTKGHKKRITLNISFDGMKICEEKSEQLMYHHLVHEISFISQDPVDNRSFGYIFGSPDTGHQFIAIKTEKPASAVTLVLRDLFQTVLEKKNKEFIQADKEDLQRAVNKSESDLMLSTDRNVTEEATVTDSPNLESESNTRHQKQQEESPLQSFDQPSPTKQEVVNQLKEGSMMFDSGASAEKDGAGVTSFVQVDSSNPQPGKSSNGMEKTSHATSGRNLDSSKQSQSMFYVLTELDSLSGHDKVASATNHVNMLETSQKDTRGNDMIESRIENVSPLEVSKENNSKKSFKSPCVNMFVPSSPSMSSHSSESSKESSSSLSWVQFVDEPTCHLKTVVGQDSSYSYLSTSCKPNALSFSSNQIPDVRQSVDIDKRSETKHQVQNSSSLEKKMCSSSLPHFDESVIFAHSYILEKPKFFRDTDSISHPAISPECDVTEVSAVNINEPTTTKKVLISDITDTLSNHITDKCRVSISTDNSFFPLVPDRPKASSVSETTDKPTASHLPTITTEPTFLEHVSHPVLADDQILGEMSTMKHKKTSFFLDNQPASVELLRATVPVAVDRDSTSVPIAVDRDRIIVPIAPDRDSTSVPVVPDRNVTTVPVAVDRDKTTVPIAVDKDSTSVPVVPDRNVTTIPIAPDRNSTSVPIVPERGWSTVPVVPDRDKTTVPIAKDSTIVLSASDRDSITVPVVPERDWATVPIALDKDRKTVPIAPYKTNSTFYDKKSITMVPVLPTRTSLPLVPERTSVPVIPERISVPTFPQRLIAVGDSGKATLVSGEEKLREVSFPNKDLNSKESESYSISDSEMLKKEKFAFDLELNISQSEDGKYPNAVFTVATTTPPPLPPRPQSLNKSASLSAINGTESFSRTENAVTLSEANTPDFQHSSDFCENAVGIKPHCARANSSLSRYEGHTDSPSSFVNINSSPCVEIHKCFSSLSDPLHPSLLLLDTSDSPNLYGSDKKLHYSNNINKSPTIDTPSIFERRTNPFDDDFFTQTATNETSRSLPATIKWNNKRME